MKKEVNDGQRVVLDDLKDAKTINAGSVFKKCHSFKLLEAVMIKDVSFDPKKPSLTELEHCHIYHSVDSYGKITNKTNAVGGHYHEVRLGVDSNKYPVIEYCSPPILNFGSDKQEVVNYEIINKGKRMIPDTHAHQGQYLKTEEIQLRQANAAAAIAMDQMPKPIVTSKDLQFAKDVGR